VSGMDGVEQRYDSRFDDWIDEENKKIPQAEGSETPNFNINQTPDVPDLA
jgi:hypothetical protein